MWVKILSTGIERDLAFPEVDDLLRGGHAVRISEPSPSTVMGEIKSLRERVETLEKRNADPCRQAAQPRD